MLSSQRICTTVRQVGQKSLAGAFLFMTLGLAGCSADISRFDLGKFSSSDSGRSTGSLNQSAGSLAINEAPVPPAPLAQPSYDGRIGTSLNNSARDSGSSWTNNRARRSDLRSTDGARQTLQPLSRSDRMRRLDSRSQRAAARPPAYRTPNVINRNSRDSVARAPAAAAPSGGETITVVSGDTLYGLARRHRVSIAALKAANGLRNNMIRPGQRLVLPGSGGPARVARPAPAVAAAPVEPREDRSASGGDYTVRPGDSIYAIAVKYRLRGKDILAANPGVDPRRLRPGQKLRLPGGNAGAIASSRNQRPRKVAAEKIKPAVSNPPRVVNTAAARKYSKIKARIINKKKPVRVASLRQDKATTARRPVRSAVRSPAKRSSAGKFRWPVKGRVIAKFGARKDGTQNDGINVSVPRGTPVHAAENGVVAYAGSELKGYGNLILIRHEGNWVTAYAHNSSLKVKRGDKVRRGQEIAAAGATGTVERPQLHFELRKGSKPVNPMPYLN